MASSSSRARRRVQRSASQRVAPSGGPRRARAAPVIGGVGRGPPASGVRTYGPPQAVSDPRHRPPGPRTIPRPSRTRYSTPSPCGVAGIFFRARRRPAAARPRTPACQPRRCRSRRFCVPASPPPAPAVVRPRHTAPGAMNGHGHFSSPPPPPATKSPRAATGLVRRPRAPAAGAPGHGAPVRARGGGAGRRRCAAHVAAVAWRQGRGRDRDLLGRVTSR